MDGSERVTARPLNCEHPPSPCLTQPEHHQALRLLNTPSILPATKYPLRQGEAGVRALGGLHSPRPDSVAAKHWTPPTVLRSPLHPKHTSIFFPVSRACLE